MEINWSCLYRRVAGCLEKPKEASHRKAAGVSATQNDECAFRTPALNGLESWDRRYTCSNMMIINTYICKFSAQMRLWDQMACH